MDLFNKVNQHIADLPAGIKVEVQKNLGEMLRLFIFITKMGERDMLEPICNAMNELAYGIKEELQNFKDELEKKCKED